MRTYISMVFLALVWLGTGCTKPNYLSGSWSTLIMNELVKSNPARSIEFDCWPLHRDERSAFPYFFLKTYLQGEGGSSMQIFAATCQDDVFSERGALTVKTVEKRIECPVGHYPHVGVINTGRKRDPNLMVSMYGFPVSKQVETPMMCETSSELMVPCGSYPAPVSADPVWTSITPGDMPLAPGTMQLLALYVRYARLSRINEAPPTMGLHIVLACP